MEKNYPNYISKEIKKTEHKYNIKALFNRLKYLSKKKIITDDFKPDKKKNEPDFLSDKTDIVELFHETNINKNKYFRNSISNSLKNNIYLKFTSKKEKILDKMTNIYETLINELFDIPKKEENKYEKKNSINFDNKIDFFKYYKKHKEKVEKLKKIENLKKSYSTIYYPNYDYIRKRIITCPKWKQISRKKQLNKSKSLPSRGYNNKNDLNDNEYNEYNDFNISDYMKTKNNFGKFKNRNTNKHNKNYQKIKSLVNTSRKENERKTFNIKNANEIQNNLFNFSKTQRITNKFYNPKKNKKTSDTQEPESKEKKAEIKKLNQYIRNGANKTFINYDFNREKVKMLVNYYPHKTNKNKVKEFKGCEIGEFLDTLRSIKILKGEKNCGINFGKMASRPSNKILPSFMSGIHSRIGCNILMDESLKMNNYSSGRFAKINDAFIPRSFNKYANLSLLKNENIQPEDVYNLVQFKYLANKLIPNINNENLNNKNFYDT